ncbi:MAG: hypothetical protein WDA02_05955 [Saccharofermentanales bacterium]
MRNLLLLVLIKLRLLVRRPLMLVLCILIPILLSLLAGASVVGSDLTQIRGAYVDQAENEASGKLVAMLEGGVLAWDTIDSSAVSRALELSLYDGYLLIPQDFGQISSAGVDEAFSGEFIAGKDRLASGIVRENVTIAMIALAFEAKLTKDLSGMEGAALLRPADLDRLLAHMTQEAGQEGAKLPLVVHNQDMEEPQTLMLVPDVAIEVLFLSVFSLLSSLMLADAATQRRMRSLPGGLRRDYLSTLLALALSGLFQLALMVGSLKLLMPSTSRPSNYLPVMAVLLLWMLAFGQLTALIPGDRRFVPSSLLLFVSVLVGGTFLRMPAIWMTAIGQYTPHGWALAQLTGIPVHLSTPLAFPLAGLLLWLAYLGQKHSTYLAG